MTRRGPSQAEKPERPSPFHSDSVFVPPPVPICSLITPQLIISIYSFLSLLLSARPFAPPTHTPSPPTPLLTLPRPLAVSRARFHFPFSLFSFPPTFTLPLQIHTPNYCTSHSSRVQSQPRLKPPSTPPHRTMNPFAAWTPRPGPPLHHPHQDVGALALPDPPKQLVNWIEGESPLSTQKAVVAAIGTYLLVVFGGREMMR